MNLLNVYDRITLTLALMFTLCSRATLVLAAVLF